MKFVKSKLILCLALVLSGGLFGCSTNVRTHRQSDASGLTCRISVSSSKLQQNKTLEVGMILKSEGSKLIRICPLGNAIGSTSQGGRNDISFRSGFFFSDGFTEEQLFKSVTTLKPGESLQLQYANHIIFAGTNTVLQISGSFNSDSNFIPEKFNCWYGSIAAKPITIKIEP